MDIFPKTNKHVVLNKHAGWNFPPNIQHFVGLKIRFVKKHNFDTYKLRPLLGVLIKKSQISLETSSELLNSTIYSFLFINKKHLGQKSINVWSLIRLCWVDFFPRINTRVDTAIRATRVESGLKLMSKFNKTKGALLHERERIVVLSLVSY